MKSQEFIDSSRYHEDKFDCHTMSYVLSIETSERDVSIAGHVRNMYVTSDLLS